MKNTIARCLIGLATVGLMLVNLIPAVPVDVLAFTMPAAKLIAYGVGLTGLLVIMAGAHTRGRALESPASATATLLLGLAARTVSEKASGHYVMLVLCMIYVIMLSAAGFLWPLAAVTSGIVLSYIDIGMLQRDAHKIKNMRADMKPKSHDAQMARRRNK
jgi:hypothetical protein